MVPGARRGRARPLTRDHGAGHLGDPGRPARHIGTGSGQVTLYTDSSALIKRYVAEDDCDAAESVLLSDAEWVTGRHTFVDVTLSIHGASGRPSAGRRPPHWNATGSGLSWSRSTTRSVVGRWSLGSRPEPDRTMRSTWRRPNAQEAGRCRSSRSMCDSDTPHDRSGSASSVHRPSAIAGRHLSTPVRGRT